MEMPTERCPSGEVPKFAATIETVRRGSPYRALHGDWLSRVRETAVLCAEAGRPNGTTKARMAITSNARTARSTVRILAGLVSAPREPRDLRDPVDDGHHQQERAH